MNFAFSRRKPMGHSALKLKKFRSKSVKRIKKNLLKKPFLLSLQMNLHVLQIIFCEKCFHEFFLHFRARALYLRGDNVITKKL